MKIKIIAVFLCGAAGFLPAQNFREEMKKAGDRIRNAARLFMEVEVNSSANPSSSAGGTKTCVFRKEGENFSYTLDEITVVKNERCMVMLNSEDKDMVYSENTKNKKEKDFYADVVSPGMDSLLARFDSIVYRGVQNSLNKYSAYSGSEIIRQVDFYFDSRQNILRKVVYHYRKNNTAGLSQVVISYRKVEFDPVFAPDEFDEKKFVVYDRKKGRKPSPAYSGYELIENKVE